MTLALNNPTTIAGASAPADASAMFWAARAWFGIAIAGQLFFVAYLMSFYGGAALRGDFAGWNRVLAKGYVPGDSVGNLVLGLHLLFAVVIIVGGALQFTAPIRRRWPWFHRWVGRMYMTSALILSLGGLGLIWIRGGAVGDTAQHAAVSLNAVLIFVFALWAWREARARRIDRHRRWVVRLFLAVSGVWFFRIGLSLWLVVNQGPVGFDPETFTGPFLTCLGFAQTLLPLAVAELYFRAASSAHAAARIAVAAVLSLCAVLTAAGVAAAGLVMWLQYL